MPKVAKNKTPKHTRLLTGIALRRKILIAAMGGMCEDCGTVENLEFNHTEPRTWCARDLSRWSRQRKYEEEWEQGLLILLCGHCNKVRGQPVSQQQEDEVPF